MTSTLPTVTGPITGGRHGWSFGRPLADLGRYGYVESEYFLDSTGPLPLGPRSPRPSHNQPTKPISLSRSASFNGIVAPNNVSAG